MSLPEKINFMPQDDDDDAAIEIGDGRVVMLHPYEDGDAEFMRTLAHRYNSFERLLEAFRQEHARCVAAYEALNTTHPDRYANLALIQELEA